jgi:CubicO group peptidase (beta-lactamase class C family)
MTRGFTLGWLLTAAAAALACACGRGGAASSAAAAQDGSAPQLATPVVDDAGIDGAIVTSGAQSVDDTLPPSLDRYDLPGIGALVLRGRAVVAEGASGVRKLGDPTPITTKDLFALGQDVQAMTATIAAVLVEDGTLSWSSTLGAVFAGTAIHASYTNVTLEQLLAQRGGAPAAIPSDIESAARVPGDAHALRTQAALSLLARGTAPPAIGAYQESDASILLAAAMLERAANQSWEALAKSRLFDPLGVTTCAFVGSDAGASPAVPWGHVDGGDGVAPVVPGGPAEPPAAFAPAQGVRCSLEDWARFAALHLEGARGEQTQILGPASFMKLQTPQDITHALGWNAVSRTFAGASLALNFTSRDASSYAIAWILPDKDTVILVAINEGGPAAQKAADDVVANLIGQFVPTQ